MKDRAILALALIGCLVTVLVAQNPQTTSTPKNSSQETKNDDQEDVVKITTNLVQVDAVVTKDGKVVRDLKAEDFEIYEDGRKQSITSFAFVSNIPGPGSNRATSPADKSAPPVAPRPLKPNEARRTVALVVDDLGLSAESMGSVRKQLRKFIDEQLDPNDLIAIIRTGGTVGALQQFTNDRRMIEKAFSQVKWNICSRVGVSVLPPARMGMVSDLGPCGVQRGWSAANTMQTLRFIVGAMEDLPGRKAMVVFSDSLPYEDQDFTARDRYGVRMPMDPVPDNVNLRGLLYRIAERAIRSSVVIYAVDASGVQYTGVTAADHIQGSGQEIARQVNQLMTARSQLLLNRREGADLIAKQTGGFLVRNSNDFRMDQIMEDQSGYYLIGYRPTEETFNRKFHHIKAKVKKSGLSLRTRFGFFGVSEEDVARFKRSPVDQTSVALMSPFGAEDINVELTALFKNYNSGSVVQSQILVNANDLSFQAVADGSQKAKIEVRSMIFGNNGIVVDQSTFNRELTLTSEMHQKALREGILLTLDTPIRNPGAYQIKVATRDTANSRIGSAGQYVIVPNLRNKQLALSGIQMEREEGASLETITRRFRVGSNVRFTFAVYNAVLNESTRLPKVSVQAVLYREGKKVFTGPTLAVDGTNQSDLARLAVSGLLRLETGLEPGNYYLQLVATDLESKDKEDKGIQWIDFEIVR